MADGFESSPSGRPPTDSSSDAFKYVYGVVRASAVPPVSSGVGDMPVELIPFGGTAAIVSDVREREIDAGRQDLMSHAQVLDEALQSGVVLPMRFGVVMASSDAVSRELLDRHQADLLLQLAELEGAVELRVRAVLEEGAVVREVLCEEPNIAQLHETLRGRDEAATYYDRIRLGEMVANAVAWKCEVTGQEVLSRLAPIAMAVDTGGPSHERVALNASFLLKRDRLAEFDEAVAEIGRTHEGRLRLKYVGPLPPYSFVELAVEA